MGVAIILGAWCAVAGEGEIAASTDTTTTATTSTSTSTSASTSGPGQKRRSLAQAPMMAGVEAGEGQAIDPVCGMTVAIAGAAHRAEHAGQTYYFCCGGCRARFLAAPASFLSPEAAR